LGESFLTALPHETDLPPPFKKITLTFYLNVYILIAIKSASCSEHGGEMASTGVQKFRLHTDCPANR